jgi:hypothetical protein
VIPHPDFDGHPARDFAKMTPEERLDDLSAKIALVWELRRARQEGTFHKPSSEAPRKGT